jgi:general secretion pathway protein N
MKLRWLIALGLIAYVVFAVATLPASVVLGRFRDAGVSAAGVEGTAWRGRAQLLTVQGVPVGRVEWNLHALALFALKLRADVNVRRTDGFLQATVEGGAQRVRFTDLTASLPLAALGNAAPRGWNGTVNLKLRELVLENGWPTAAQGTVDLLQLVNTTQRGPFTGSYKITFPEGAVADGALRGTVADIDGPLQVAGTIELYPNRSYVVRGLTAPKPDAPPSLVSQLQMLGPPDAQGRRNFSWEGAY